MGFWQRVAEVIDGIILFIIAAIAASLLHAAADILIFLISIAYFTWLEGGIGSVRGTV